MSWDRFISSISLRRRRAGSSSGSRRSRPTSPTPIRPAIKARDVEPFNKVLDANVGHARDDVARRTCNRARPRPTRKGHAKKDSWEVVHSGNSVSLEQEMIKAGDVNRDYSLNTAIVRSFHRMFLSSAKS